MAMPSVNPFDYIAAAAQGALGAAAAQAGLGPAAVPPPPPPAPPPKERVRVVVKRVRDRSLSARDVLPYAAVGLSVAAMVVTLARR